MKIHDLIELYNRHPQLKLLPESLRNNKINRISLKGITGSADSVIASAVCKNCSNPDLFIFSDKETAAYFYNDMENLLEESDKGYDNKNSFFFPSSCKRAGDYENPDNTNVLLRTEVLNKINSSANINIITYPAALTEKVVTKDFLKKNTLKISVNDNLTMDFITEMLVEYGFERVDFVVEAGQFSIRGGIVDIFSYGNDYPYRIELAGDSIGSVRTFDSFTQLSVDRINSVSVVPNIVRQPEKKESLFSFLPQNTVVWADDISFVIETLKQEYGRISENISNDISCFINEQDFLNGLENFSVIEFGKHSYFSTSRVIEFNMSPQPFFNKNFRLFIDSLKNNSAEGYENIIVANSQKQIERINSVIDDTLQPNEKEGINYTTIYLSLHEGFIDKDLKIACYTDHQIFERYHRYRLRDSLSTKETLSIKELYNLKPGDYITHIDHGIGRFDGLEKIEVNGKQQEAIRLIYKGNDILYISIHSLHRISKYAGKEGTEPVLHRLGSNAWENIKNKTKHKIKDIAKDLIALYAKRKKTSGFAFSPDTYMQNELEASFIYEDTPDQLKATVDVKKDMENDCPMDRLICGDVGFGKTEIAIRAAFKCVSDSKQVAVLVPTTILALQHYNTFKERMHDFPCKIEYLNRFKSSAAQKKILKQLQDGQIDIIIGTHRLVSKDIKFKDLGLLIIDEEQKFGVAAKEKLKQFKVEVDTLTLTATPIPRTLQFSLMGARDLSVISTPPPNRYPIETQMISFNEETIRDAINYEVSRGGQVFFVHNRINNIYEISDMLRKFCPDVRVVVAHGQMEGNSLEKAMVDFINGDYDILVSTTIIESGLDIPNVNTIIINAAHNYGLSDLHQLRGRVGRTNKKAFCLLISPPLSVLTDEARKRLKAIEEFSDLGSGFNIAMRDLDIRGAGNILGAEQSGFITELGFETYHKILDEAITELKENEFKESFTESKQEEFTGDCQIETDMEILIPDSYIENITERLSLYKELDSIGTEKELENFSVRLHDRFGPIPAQTYELINTIRLRWTAGKIGFEKIILKNNRFTGYFVSNKESSFYQSETFTKILDYVKLNPRTCSMQERKNRLTLSFNDVDSIDKAIGVLNAVLKV